ncbi:MAG: hypothetical protein WCX95_03390 [Candidatus Gracilibacteria bacterium]
MDIKTKQNQQKKQELSREDMYIMDTIAISDTLYEAILMKLDIDQKDVIYKNLILGVLQRQTRDDLVLSIWKNMDGKQRAHLRDFVDETAITAPFMKLDDILMTFANLYPNLMTKVYKDLTKFFQNFIENFNRIKKTSF